MATSLLMNGPILAPNSAMSARIAARRLAWLPPLMCPSAPSSSRGATPSASPSRTASAASCALAANRRLLTSLTASAVPSSPVSMTGSPYARTTPAARARAAGGPPSRTVSRPALISSGAPLTGASTTWIAGKRSATDRKVDSRPVTCEASTPPSGRAAASGPAISVTCSSLNTHSSRTSAPAATSASSDVGRTPSGPRLAVASGRRAYTTRSCPAAASRPTIGRPIRPAPTNPTRKEPIVASCVITCSP